MSVQALTAVMEHSEARGSARVVMFVLADHADECGFCWPGIERLAFRSRIDHRNVQRHLASLKDMGELSIYYRKGRPNVYQLLLAGLHEINDEQAVKLRAWGVTIPSSVSAKVALKPNNSFLTTKGLVLNGSGGSSEPKTSPLAKSPPPCGNCGTLLEKDGYCPGCGLIWQDGKSNAVVSL